MTPDADVDRFIASIDPATMRDGRHLRAVSAAAAADPPGEDALARAVGDARAAGDSWTMIGIALGTTAHAAQARFDKA